MSGYYLEREGRKFKQEPKVSHDFNGTSEYLQRRAIENFLKE